MITNRNQGRLVGTMSQAMRKRVVFEHSQEVKRENEQSQDLAASMNIITGGASSFNKKKKPQVKKNILNGKRVIKNAQKYFEKNPTYIREEDIYLSQIDLEQCIQSFEVG